MSISERWLLPEGIEEILPDDACQLETIRRRLLDLFRSWGYELVMPPMIEFLDSLLTGVGQDLDLQTLKVTDQLTGRLMGVRADMTPQVARIEAHYLRRAGPVRLCYLGPVLRTRPDAFGGTREPLQLGAEIFGHAGPESDAEVLHLMIQAMSVIGIDELLVDFGHVGVFRELARGYGLEPGVEMELFDALQRKAVPDIDGLLKNSDIPGTGKRAFMALVDLNGGKEVLDAARQVLDGAGEGVAAALENLEQIVRLVERLVPEASLHFDLAELRGYRYYTGAMFSIFTRGHGQAIAHGGRYDDIGRAFGYARPATGFSTDLRMLLKLLPRVSRESRAILAPSTEDAAAQVEVARLREAGECVIRRLPGVDETEVKRRCDRQLVKKGERWAVVGL